MVGPGDPGVAGLRRLGSGAGRREAKRGWGGTLRWARGVELVIGPAPGRGEGRSGREAPLRHGRASEARAGQPRAWLGGRP